MPAIASTNDTAAQTSTANEDDQAIYNRSPTINHNYYSDTTGQPPLEPRPVPSGGSSAGILPWVLLLLLTLLLASGLAWWALNHWRQPVPIPTPTPVPTPTPQPQPQPTNGGNWYLGVKVVPGQ